ncbi:hypothetical protein SAMN05444401_1523 [Clostridium amylolyticum]|uniref:Uncharacterized protein n=1 Tax=Clostridium amylolyticum TaxID=1121298 RepID=A0A1M6EBM8_9CLOT|nr:hypothetical protein [Clostridium amylolyticum]SHI82917.1 hypothetical protein SAMN05444401_1523 [Clostridium amylolyticum]
MGKKISIIVFMLLLFTSVNAYAGDIPESILLGNQNALFIGKITSAKNDTYSIEPSTIMMGRIETKQIQIKKFDKYYGTEDKPKVGDSIVVRLLEDNKIDDLWIFKSTSLDYKTLRLLSERHDMVVRYEKYLNEGKYSEAQKKIDEKNLTASSTTTTVQIAEREVDHKEKSYLNSTEIFSIVILLFAVIVILFRFILKKRNNRIEN